MGSKDNELISFLKKRGGLAGYSEIIKAGFRKGTLKVLLRSGRVDKIDRALYKLQGGIDLPNPDFVTVSIKAPQAVICLLSALAFHEVTSEISRYVDLAIPRGSHANRIKYPPVRFYRFAPNTWEAGVEDHEMEGRRVKIYNLAKTIADCFKFRNKIGINVAREALKVAVAEKRISPKEIMRYAKICRVGNIIKPILESIA
jgi:predicted transcriptional regulator of viral defense system